MSRPTIIDQFGTRQRFLAVLVSAELFASNNWEMDYTNDMRNRFERYGDAMSMTNEQRNKLRRIAGF